MAIALVSPLFLQCTGGDPSGPTQADLCNATTLPLSGSPDGPTVTDVRLQFEGSIIYAHVIATDPQGTDDLLNVIQRITVFQDRQCAGSFVTLRKSLMGSGVDESFGAVLTFGEDQSLYNEMVFAVTWPVGVVVADASGNATMGRVLARVVRY
jgi:hypothetical protein